MLPECAHRRLIRLLIQQGTINPPKCERSQNGRGGLFFIVESKELFDTMSDLLDGESEPVKQK